MADYRGNLKVDGRQVSGHHHIRLDGSKSISNRVLIIQHLCEGSFDIAGLSSSDDTESLKVALASNTDTVDVHHAGTSFRFLTALLSLDSQAYTLTGSSRMKERPIGPLVDALRQLGASIEYIEKEGFPPLKIEAFRGEQSPVVEILGSISSQFITALLLIAPTLENGIELNITGDLVSRPYIEMTLQLMQYFGINYSWQANVIKIAPQVYQARDIIIEADWSAASYYYSMVATADDLEVTLGGLTEDSMQGDAAIAEIMQHFGVISTYNESERSVTLNKNNKGKQLIEYNFIKQPDLAQTIAVCAGINDKKGLFSGLQTLKIKETDRIEALKNELVKYGVYLSALPARLTKKEGEEFYMLDGKLDLSTLNSISTYRDHRMAMAFAPIGIKAPVIIENAEVVTKSYPKFWEDLESIGFDIQKQSAV